MGTGPDLDSDDALGIAALLEAAAAGGEEPVAEDLLVALARERPRSGFEMARALEESVPGLVDGNEGVLYPALAALVRSGRLESRWVAADGAPPRRVYGPPGSIRAEADGAGAPEPPAGPRLRRTAEAATRSIRDPFAREEARAEVLSHLAASAAEREAAGAPSPAAERAAARALGDPWRIRTELGRVHAGRAALVFPRTAGDRLRALLVYDLVPLLLVLGGLLLVRWQVLQPYNIPTKSMEPTLHGDRDDPDFILVDKTAFRFRDIERWEVAVFLPPERPEPPVDPGGEEEEDEGRQPFVKRCVGLGGESLDLRGGDAWVDGALARRPLAIEDAMMVPLYDMGGDLRRAAGRARMGPLSMQVFGISWGREDGEQVADWTIRGIRLEAEPGPGGETRLDYLRRTTNSYLDHEGEEVTWSDDAGDLEVRFVAEAVDAGAVAGADLVEGEARHSLRIGPAGVEVRSGDRSWSSSKGRLAPGRPTEVGFRNVDDRLTVRVDGEVVLREELPPRAVVPEALEPGGVALVASKGRVAFGGVRILRDIVYRWQGRSEGARSVPEGGLFMLGDNTASSNDSRAWGPVRESDLIGRPFLVAWPPSRLRRIR
jgi:signal peptidase I